MTPAMHGDATSSPWPVYGYYHPERAGGLLVPVAAPAPQRPDMVGREFERAELAAALGAAQQGDGRAALLLGEAGMGKSVLADWLVRQARDLGCAGGPRGVFGGRHGPAVAVAAGARRDRAAAAVAGRRWSSSTSASGREVLAAAVVDAIAEAARRDPLLVVIEDLHWCDPASLTVLRAVVDAVPALPVMLLLTCRDDPQEALSQVSDQLADLPAGVRRILLSPIGVDAVADLAGGVVGRTLSERDVRDLHARTGGNPFFVHEVARLLLAHGPSGALRVPPGVEEVLRRRVARLGQPCATLLAAAAVAAESAEDRVETDLLAAVSELRRRGGGSAARRGGGCPAARRRSGAAVAPPFPARADPRGAGARACPAPSAPGCTPVSRRRWTDRPGASAARLAHHWCRAAGDGAGERAADVVGARRARGDGRVRVRGRRGPLRPRAGGACGGPDPDPRRVRRGRCQLGGDTAAAREALLDAARAAAAADRATDLAHAALALGGGVAGFEVAAHDDEQTDLLRQADRALPAAEAGLRAAVRARLSLAPGRDRVRHRAGPAGRRRRRAPHAAPAPGRSSPRRWPPGATRWPDPITSVSASPLRPA